MSALRSLVEYFLAIQEFTFPRPTLRSVSFGLDSGFVIANSYTDAIRALFQPDLFLKYDLCSIFLHHFEMMHLLFEKCLISKKDIEQLREISAFRELEESSVFRKLCASIPYFVEIANIPSLPVCMNIKSKRFTNLGTRWMSKGAQVDKTNLKLLSAWNPLKTGSLPESLVEYIVCQMACERLSFLFAKQGHTITSTQLDLLMIQGLHSDKVEGWIALPRLRKRENRFLIVMTDAESPWEVSFQRASFNNKLTLSSTVPSQKWLDRNLSIAFQLRNPSLSIYELSSSC